MKEQEKNSIKQPSLQHLLIKWFLLLTLIPLITISLLSYLQSRESLINKATNELAISAHETKTFIDNWFSYRMIDISNQAENQSTVQNLATLTKNYQQDQKPLASFVKSDQWAKQIGTIGDTFINMQRNYDYIYDIFLIDDSANILFNLTQEDDLGTNLQSGKYKSTYFAKTVLTSLQTGKVSLSKIERYAPSNNLLSAFISTPLVNEQGDLVGIIAIQIKLDSIYNLIVDTGEHTDSLVHYIINEKGQLQTPIKNDWQTVLNKNISLPAFKVWQQHKSNESKEHHQYKNIDDEAVIGIFQTINIANINWILVTEMSLDEILTDANWLVSTIFWLVVFSVVVVTIVIFILSKSITKPLKDLANASLRVASGETELQIEQSSSNEIDQLTSSFNYMLEKRNQHQKELEQSHLQTQDALASLEEQKYAIDQHSIVAITDTKGTITFVNDKFCQISGYSQAELIGQNHRLLNSRMQGKDYWRAMYETIKQGKTWHDEICNISKNGDLYWVDSTIIPFMDKSNHPKSYIAIRTEITDRKKQEFEIQQNTKKLSLVINNTGIGFWDWNITSGFIECNPRWYEITGYDKAGLAPFTVEKFGSLLHPDDAPKVMLQLEKHINNEKEIYDIELRIKHKKGHWVWLNDKGSVVEHNKKRKPIRMIGTMFDITDRKQQEIEQEYNYKITKTKFEITNILNQNIPINNKLDNAIDECFKLEGLHLLNKGGVFLLSEEKVGLNTCSLRGNFSADFISNEQPIPLACYRLCEKVAQSGEISIGSNCIENHCPDSSCSNITSHGHYIVPLIHNQENKPITVGVLFFYTVINPNNNEKTKTLLIEIGSLFTTAIVQEQASTLLKKATEVAEQSSHLKSEFLASMSHEIRTPMNGVLGMLGLLLNSELNYDQQHKALLAKSSAESLLTLINDILDFSKIEADKMGLEFYDFNLRGMLGDFAETMALKAQNKGLEVILDITKVEQSMVKGDQGRIRQVLTNIVGNAIKFTQHGEIIIRVATVPVGQRKLLLSCSVQDSGIGIPENKLETLFDTFSQIDASTTRKYGGTGLGLAITKKLCQLMNGDINVSSHHGTGSTFEFSAIIEPSEKSQRVMPKVDISKLNILIVDDNRTNLEVLRGQLEHWGATITESTSGEQALSLCNQCITQAESSLFDIAFLDMQMPEMDGAELGKTIRSNPEFNSIKLVMMTSISQGNEARFFADIGFNAYFPKPATTSDLFDALAVVMDKNEQVKTSQIVTHDYLQSFTHSNNNIIWPNNTKILLVEDNRINQQVALGILENFNLTTDIAVNGIEALEILKFSSQNSNDKPFTLILMDCQMPEMDGYQTSREIRNNKSVEQYRNIPIIAMTANAMEGDKEKCFDAGMSDYLAKPIEPERLKERLEHWLCVKNPVNNTIKKQAGTKHDKEVTLNSENKPIPVWNKTACLKRVSNNQALLEGLIGIFIEDTPRMISDLTQAIELNSNPNEIQYQQIYECAHALKGVSGNLSGIALNQVASKLEVAAKKNNISEINEWYLKLNSNYQALLKEFEIFLASE